MADRTAEIATLETLLNSGALEVDVDGVRTKFASPDDIRKRTRELKNETRGLKSRPRIVSMDVGGFC